MRTYDPVSGFEAAYVWADSFDNSSNILANVD